MSDQRSSRQGTFRISITYFKANGKFYTSAQFEWTGACIEGEVRANPSPNMNDVVATVRGWRDHGGQGSLPGLSRFSGGWDGYILVDHPLGYPCLILPPN